MKTLSGSCPCGDSFKAKGDDEAVLTVWREFNKIHEGHSSALRAAQPLAKEKIDSLIDARINEPHLDTWAAGAWDLRDALLDSLADKGE